MHYRVYFRVVNSERWLPVRIGDNPKQFAMHSDAVEASLAVMEKRWYKGKLIVDTMIMTIDEVIFKTEDGEHRVTLLELC